MNPSRLGYALLVAFVAFAAPDANALLLYGHTYGLQNDNGNNWSGGYLDAIGSYGDGTYVGTASSTTRSGESGSWLIMPGAHSSATIGSPVQTGDEIVLMSLAGQSGNGGFYLYTNGCPHGTGSASNPCVSTLVYDSYESTNYNWQIKNVGATGGNVVEGMPISLKGEYPGSGFLATSAASACSTGDVRCSSIAVAQDTSESSTTWRFVQADSSVSSSLTDNGSLITTGPVLTMTTAYPQNILMSDSTSLYWDVFGNLNLINFAAYDYLTGGMPTMQTWGVGSTTPLLGSAAATLTWQWGVLTITNSAGKTVWQSTDANGNVDSLIKSSLSISACTVTIEGQEITDNNGTLGTASVTAWTESTTECNKRSLLNNNATNSNNSVCWPNSSATVNILYDNDSQTYLQWYDGILALNNAQQSLWYNGALYGLPGGQLCFQNDGNLVMYTAQGEAVFDTSSGSPVSNGLVSMTLDGCGFSFNSGNLQYAREERTSLLAQCNDRSLPGWCRTTSAPGHILVSATNGHLEWTSDGYLQAWANMSPYWNSNNTNSGAELCFTNTGDLVVSSPSGSTLWAASNSGGAQTSQADVLAFDGTDVVLTNGANAAYCESYDEPVCPTDGGPCGPPPVNAPAECTTPAYWTVWDSGAVGQITYLSGGGFSYVDNDQRGNQNIGVDLWVLGAANNANTLNSLQNTLPSGSSQLSAAQADLPATPAGDYMEVMGATGVNANLFGATAPIFSVNTYGRYDDLGNGQADGQMTTMASGGYTWGYVGQPEAQAPVTPNATGIFWSGELWTPTEPSLYVVLDIDGELGASMTSGTITSSNFSYQGSATGSLYVSASLGGSVGGAEDSISVGLECDMTLVKFNLPITMSADWTSRHYSNAMSLSETTLQGQLIAAVYLDSAISEQWTLAHFTGHTVGETLFTMTDMGF